MTTDAPWYACPACGCTRSRNSKKKRPKNGWITGQYKPTFFLDGEKAGKPWHCNQGTWSLLCPCGHIWQIVQTDDSLIGKTYMPIEETTASSAQVGGINEEQP